MAAAETAYVASTHDDDAFQTDCEDLAKEFIKLYFKDLKHVSKGTGEQIAYEYVPDQSNDKQACRVVAERLKEISDEQIERGFDTEMASRSVFEIGQQQFTAMCRSALVKCSDIITSGWQQVYTVCYGVARVVEELRQQPGYPESHRRQREVHIQRFVGPTMQDLGLDVWIEEHGGLKQTPVEADTKVHIESSV